jgi:hypothetical protein
MKLTKYLVQNFRSVRDSGWIEVDSVTSLIGVNESGKTNLLVPLWKLNPARDGEIRPTEDYPKTMFGEIRQTPGNYWFIAADFDLDDALMTEVAKLAAIPRSEARSVRVCRNFAGDYSVQFPLHLRKIGTSSVDVLLELGRTIEDLRAQSGQKQEESWKSTTIDALTAEQAALRGGAEYLDLAAMKGLSTALAKLVPASPPKLSALVPRLQQFLEQVDGWVAAAAKPLPGQLKEVRDKVIESLPTFVYYSNYGNLDSEIYLPHVVENLEREKKQALGAKEAAKARTLRVLFKFVKLSPKEILQLGQEVKSDQVNAQEIEAVSEKKRERAILLQSAGATLTQRFRDWWKQGDYRFRFDADGNHFRIWVADERRPAEIELESRSTGLQWFLSFYLVFLVESEGDHNNAILLLDEPGLSLHPLAQRDLSDFFANLSCSNQLIFTTHSPFLIDADHLDRVRKVYVDDNGETVASPNLRQGAGKDSQGGASYAVYSALNMNMSESLLWGCLPIVVEGPSDQHLLTMMKLLLISGGRITPARELVFPPGGGTKTIRITSGILTGRDDHLPVVLLDSDTAGTRMAKELRSSMYVAAQDKVLQTDSYVGGLTGSEVEDLVPLSLYAEAVDKLERRPDVPFADKVAAGTPVVLQVESWAKTHGVQMAEGWKVDVARRVKQLGLTRGLAAFDEVLVANWTRLFSDFIVLSDSK